MIEPKRLTMGSTPRLTEFNPHAVPYQYQVIKDIRQNFDYSNGKHEIMLSGAVGSAKSILLAHLAVTHCLLNPEARFCIGRLTMADLKSTLFQKILEHIDCDELVDKRDYEINLTKSSIKFKNRSEIISRSWHDKKFTKFRSLELSSMAIEELTENTNEYKKFYSEAQARVGRLPHIKETFIACATNPDSPTHWAYEHFIKSKNPNRHVYYSVTTDNPFLPDWYFEQLLEDYDPKEAQRMLYGQWISLATDVIYHQYDQDGETHFKPNTTWIPKEGIPIHVCWDFNIGLGKPLSACLFQYINGVFHFFNECVVEGQRTEDSLDEMAGRGLFEYNCRYIVHGDATGRRRDTRSTRSDYDIIDKYLRNYKTKEGRPLRVFIDVPRDNPRVRERHNRVNAQMRNAKGQIRLQVYKGCETLDKGFRLTHLKKGGQYIEDDSDSFQHITTAAGYGIMSVKSSEIVQEASMGEY